MPERTAIASNRNLCRSWETRRDAPVNPTARTPPVIETSQQSLNAVRKLQKDAFAVDMMPDCSILVAELGCLGHIGARV
jgi:hypothetical protein